MKATREEAHQFYSEILEECVTEKQRLNAMFELSKIDIFFLSVYVCNIFYLDHDWAYDRCKDIQQDINNTLYIWGRGHLKSTLAQIKIIQDILINQNVTVLLMSYKVDTAVDGLTAIKQFLALPIFYKMAPHIFYENPTGRNGSPRWNATGITVKRSVIVKTPTVLTSGFSSLPTGHHASVIVIDDAVTRESVSSPAAIQETIEVFNLIPPLGCGEGTKMRLIGTFYSHADLYNHLIDNNLVNLSLHPATVGGKWPGKPVFRSLEFLEEEERRMGEYQFSCQYLCKPQIEGSQVFKSEWLADRLINISPRNMNIYITVDPASAKRATSDNTVMCVIGIDSNHKYYLIDMVVDKLSMPEKIDTLRDLVLKYNPKCVGYERYAAQTDRESINMAIDRGDFPRVNIVDITRSGKIHKDERIKNTLVPIFARGDFYIQREIKRSNFDHPYPVNLVSRYLLPEYEQFPFAQNDDVLDSLSMIMDTRLNVRPPYGRGPLKPNVGNTKFKIF